MMNPLPMKEYLHFFLKAAHCGSYRRWRLQLLVTIRPQTQAHTPASNRVAKCEAVRARMTQPSVKSVLGGAK